MFNEAETSDERTARLAREQASRDANRAGTAKKLSYIGCIFGDIMRST